MKSFEQLLEEESGFHDLNVGFWSYERGTFHLAIEDHSRAKKTTDLSDVPIVARITASGMRDLSFMLDCAMPDVIYEVTEPEPGRLEINMINGGIRIEAEKIDIKVFD